MTHCDLVVIGGGPAGLAAAVNASSEGLHTRVIAEQLGGQAFLSPRIENYLGFEDGITGAKLAETAGHQAVKFGASILVPHLAVALDVDMDGVRVTQDDGDVVECRTAVLAMGAKYRLLDAPGADRLTGHGIYYGSALSVGDTYKDQPVAVVGGANSAAQSVLHLARYSSDVYLLVRGAGLDKMSRYLVDRIEATPNIHCLFNTEVIAVAGDDHVQRVLVSNGTVTPIDVRAVFAFIGATPPTRWLARTDVKLDDYGFVVTGDTFETSMPGVFAAGDVRSGSVKRVASAAGEGAMVVQFIHRHLNE